MAQRGKPIPATTAAVIKRLAVVLSNRKAAKEAGVAVNTLRKYGRPASPPSVSAGSGPI